ncbi:hypothetical protein EV132_101679 [Rhizobium sullae]|uniref:Uncharacterized protein n=1 Tax=Rhizobium sullae TaxID=50338 RepID=A0A4R3QL20_RHISU|nr:hypothetical protein EV132_101679 [Rhizobium sullae]
MGADCLRLNWNLAPSGPARFLLELVTTDLALELEYPRAVGHCKQPRALARKMDSALI